MRIRARVVTSTQKMERRMLRALSREVSARFQSLVSPIQTQTRALLQVALEASPEYQSLLSGQLRTELGVVDPFNALTSLTASVVGSVYVTSTGVRIKNKQVFGKIRLVAVPEDIVSRIKMFGSYITEKGTVIPWLEWLLTAGDQIIVRDYGVSFRFPQHSRTGGAVMVSGDKGWRVPPQFSGVEGSNFITRAVDTIAPELENFITQTFKNKF